MPPKKLQAALQEAVQVREGPCCLSLSHTSTSIPQRQAAHSSVPRACVVCACVCGGGGGALPNLIVCVWW